MVEGKHTTLADHFQTLDWLLDQLSSTSVKFGELAKSYRSRPAGKHYSYLGACADVAWQKADKYMKLVDETAAYYAAVVMDPTLKKDWFEQQWRDHPDKSSWIAIAEHKLEELWREQYKGKFSTLSAVQADPTPQPAQIDPKKKYFTSARLHKRIKVSHNDIGSPLEVDRLQEYLQTNRVDFTPKDDNDHFDVIGYWIDRLDSQPDLARFALDVFACPPMSDEVERLFSSAKILLKDRRARLKMDIIEANECLRHFYGKPEKGSFDEDEDIRVEQPLSIEERIKQRQAQDISQELALQANEEAGDKVIELEEEFAAIEALDDDDDEDDVDGEDIEGLEEGLEED